MSDHQASVTNFCAHEFKRDETFPSSTAIIWRCEKCKAVVGNTLPSYAAIHGQQKSNFPSA